MPTPSRTMSMGLYKSFHTSIRAFIPYAHAPQMIRALNRLGAQELSIAHASKCITTLHVASQSGGCLIQHEQRPTGVRRPAHEGLEAALHQTEPREKNLDEPQWPCLTPLRSGQGHLYLSRSILTYSQAHRMSIEERPAGHLSRSLEQHGHLPGGGLRSSGMPHEGHADPVSG